MVKSDEGKKVGAPAGLRDDILLCVLISIGSVKDFCLKLAPKPPTSPSRVDFSKLLRDFLSQLSAKTCAAFLF
ncbi:hypothetical protein Pyn_35254 [Prunus yedoensis var. nudiflora]|uniref:Uncharacterized protein n=1 Tax=Prunus yedoensis var. nudiflora TaxID=2094558 RepID=A0A314ZDC4_PRUYE|nr:hypothetical protein Pyn_35254 [Prunus yedoensis var. nudiflora]